MDCKLLYTKVSRQLKYFIYLLGSLEFPEACPGRYCGRQLYELQLNLTEGPSCYSECGVSETVSNLQEHIIIFLFLLGMSNWFPYPEW